MTTVVMNRSRNVRTILDTPPSARMSAGTRSRAITAHAPASSAIRAY